MNIYEKIESKANEVESILEDMKHMLENGEDVRDIVEDSLLYIESIKPILGKIKSLIITG